MSNRLDLFIVDEGAVFHVSKERWMQPANRIDPDVVGDAAVLVKRGALVADVPRPSIPVGFYCVLLNLAELVSGAEAEEQECEAQEDTVIGEKGLIIHALPDAYYILKEDDWKVEQVERELDPGLICAEYDDGFVVNLSRFVQS